MQALIALLRFVFGLAYLCFHFYIVREVYKVNTTWHTILTAVTFIVGDLYWCYQWGAVALGVTTLAVGLVSFVSGLALESSTA